MPEVGKPSSGIKRCMETRGITDWNNGTELLKQHADSQWHRDAAATAVMARQAESGKSVLELQCSSAAQQAAERRQRNRDVLLSCCDQHTFLPRIESHTQQFIRI